MSETRLVGDTLAALNRLQGCKAWRNNTGAVTFGKRPVKFGEKGAPDILGVFFGRAFGVENKAPKGRQRPAQKKWQREFEAAGGLYILAKDIQTTLTALNVTPNHPARASGRVFPR